MRYRLFFINNHESCIHIVRTSDNLLSTLLKNDGVEYYWFPVALILFLLFGWVTCDLTHPQAGVGRPVLGSKSICLSPIKTRYSKPRKSSWCKKQCCKCDSAEFSYNVALFSKVPRILPLHLDLVSLLIIYGGHDIVVSTATRCLLDGPRFWSRWWRVYLSRSDRPRQPLSFLCTEYDVFPRGKVAKAWCWPITSF